MEEAAMADLLSPLHPIASSRTPVAAGAGRSRRAAAKGADVAASGTRAWWDPEAFAGRRPYLAARSRIVAAIRAFFAERDFSEVETPALQVSPGLEPHLMAFATELISADQQSRRGLYL